MATQELSVCLAGATGWTGRALVRGILDAPDLRLAAAVSRSAAGADLGEALGGDALGVPVHATVAEALEGVDVLVDYTSATAVRANTLAAVSAGVPVVVGTLGPDRRGLRRDRRRRARARGRGRRVGQLLADRRDGPGRGAPRGPAPAAVGGHRLRERDEAGRPVGHRAGARRAPGRRPRPAIGHPIADLHGPQEARGATVGGTQIHSVRLPSFVVSTEVVFGLPDERLTIRHDAGGTPEPYVAGTLIAVRRVPGLVGVTRGLDTLLLGDG